jgi:hypothetical protein
MMNGGSSSMSNRAKRAKLIEFVRLAGIRGIVLQAYKDDLDSYLKGVASAAFRAGEERQAVVAYGGLPNGQPEPLEFEQWWKQYAKWRNHDEEAEA